ncbi:MAG: flagellar hook-associated protein FlgK [Deltaproteobacteria bacterium]|nr:MAG: flagellar hook-associated protein FlgK [Deltaproteobacteria bacterium]
MSGLGLVLSIAKTALFAQRYGIDVTAHNIANVNTPSYSRQSPVIEAKEPASYGGVLLGQGVDTTDVVRTTDQFVENQLMQQKSCLLSSKEMEGYMQILEGLFNENSETSISVMLAEFWNLWHDLSNHPAGAAERTALYQHGILLSRQFNNLEAELTELETNLTSAVNVGVERINEITREIADINIKIVGVEAAKVANDLRDKRTGLVSELSEYIDVKTFEQSNGSLTIITAKGCVLVQGSDSYDLEMGGVSGDRVTWQSSGSAYVDLTDYLTKGNLGGWLAMRDEVIAKYKLDLNALAKEFIWAINHQHTQGVGLHLFEPGSTLAGTYQTSTDLDDLDFGSEIQFVVNGFKLWFEDRTVPANPVMNFVSVDLSGLNGSSTLSNLATAINNQITAAGLTGVTVSVSGDAITFTAGSDYAFGFSEDTSNILGALGVNTFFQGVGAGSMSVNTALNDKDYIAAAQIEADGSYASGDNTNALAIADLQYTSMGISQWTCDRINGNTEGTVTTTIEHYYHGMVSSIGITSESISRGREYNEVMVSKLSEIRDSISAVSLDEEMTNLIKFQHAYTAAAKLISVSDEMLETLLSTK